MVTVYSYSIDSSIPPRQRLIQAASRFLGAASADKPWDIIENERGKPRFAQYPQLHFSVTHSGAYWLCALAQCETGLDLQKHEKTKRSDISRRFFHPNEDAFLKENGYRDFFDVWSAKESYVKFTGQGIDDSFSVFSVVSERGIAECVNGAALQKLSFQPGYSLFLCTKEPVAVSFVFAQQS